MFGLQKADWRLLVWVFAVALAARAVLLCIYGPVKAPDSDGYIAYAQIILSGKLNALDMEADLAAQTAFRAIGYPAVIAGVIALVGSGWPWLIVALQIGLSLVVIAALYAVMHLLTSRRAWAVLAAVAYGLSLPLVFDQMILTDSLAGSLLLLAVCGLAACILQRRRLRWWGALLVGLLLALTFLLREASLLLAGVGLLPLALAAAFADRLRQAPWLALLPRIGVALLVLLPGLLAWQGYRQWNQERFGVAFVTTGAQSTLLQGLAIAAEHDKSVFDTAHDFDRVAAEIFSTYSLDEVWLINARLRRDYGWTADRIAREAYASYFRAWRQHPLAMLRIPLEHMRMNLAMAPFQPLASIRLLHLWATGEPIELGTRRAMREGHWAMLPVFLLDNLCRAIAIIIFIAFAFGTPWLLLRRRWAVESLAAAGIWCLFAAMFSGYAMVHLEVRYLLPAIGGATVIGLFNIREFWHIYHAKRMAGRTAGGQGEA